MGGGSSAASYGFLRRPVWIVGAMLAVIAAAIFVGLGMWQLDRHAERRAANDTLVAALAAPPVDVGEATTLREYRKVTATGEFRRDQVLVQGRSRRGSSGFHVLAALSLPAGPTLVVDRGWIPVTVTEDPRLVPAPPPGSVRVEGVVREPQPRAKVTPPAGGLPAKVSRVDLAALTDAFGDELLPFYVQLTAQEPPPEPGAPLLADPPEPDAGPHLGYAVQWFAFAAIAVVGFPALVVRTARDGPVRWGRERDRPRSRPAPSPQTPPDRPAP